MKFKICVAAMFIVMIIPAFVFMTGQESSCQSCGKCYEDADCSSGQTCDTVEGKCVDCTNDSQCELGKEC